MRARVAWIQRPHSTREFFQVAVELETPGNVWEMDSANGEGASAISPTAPSADLDVDSQPYCEEESVSDATSVRETYYNPRESTEETMTDPAKATLDTSFDVPLEYPSQTAQSPLFEN